MERKKYYLCRYVRTDEIDQPARAAGFIDYGNGFEFIDYGNGFEHTLPRAASYVYRLKRTSGELFLTAQEAIELDIALSEEGCPHLLPEDKATEGKRL